MQVKSLEFVNHVEHVVILHLEGYFAILWSDMIQDAYSRLALRLKIDFDFLLSHSEQTKKA